MRVEIRVLFRGKVQGVGFRATAALLARELAVVGEVKNLQDGSVSLVAQAERATLEKYLAALQGEFAFAEAEVSFCKGSTPFLEFRIVR